VLVADDDPDILELVTLRLERAGYRVLAATNGGEALDLALARVPDLLVLDIAMPILLGTEVLAEVREQPRTRHIPSVLLTARVGDSDVEHGFEVGADAYVKKPFEPGKLVGVVDSLVGVGRMRMLADE
jgi:CheY-like chemotaxis protein